MINAEPKVTEVAQMSNINIITCGGKNTEADQGTLDQPTVIRVALPNLPYNYEQQK